MISDLATDYPPAQAGLDLWYALIAAWTWPGDREDTLAALAVWAGMLVDAEWGAA